MPNETEYRERLARLRGRLPATPIGARELAHLARNQECDRLLLHRLARLDPAAVVRAVFAEPAEDQGSELALATGVTFERVLLRDRGALLLDMFRRAGRLGDSAAVVNVEALAPGSDADSLRRRERITRELLGRKLAGDPEAPAVLWHARLALDVDGEAVAIEPDLLTAAARDSFYRPGEVKSYRDRGPRTNPSDVLTSRLQGAVEVLALRDTIHHMGATDVEALVPDRFDLVLRSRLGMRPSLREIAIRREITTMRRVLSRLRSRALRVLSQIDGGTTLDSEGGHVAVHNRLFESCRDHCAFAARCEAAARLESAPIVLGSAMVEAVGAVGSLARLLRLVAGDETPLGEDESRIAASFRQARVIADREVRRAG